MVYIIRNIIYIITFFPEIWAKLGILHFVSNVQLYEMQNGRLC